MQHYLYKRTFQNEGLPWPLLVPSSYKFALKSGDRVLDAATGTAAWLLDAAASFTPDDDIYFDGVDISPAQFPLKEKLASIHPNISLSIHNILDLPASWNNRYTLVHQRMVNGALSRAQWKTSIDQIHRVLKPGGWAIWVEPGVPFGG